MIKYRFLFFILLACFGAKAQQIINTKALYKNDTLTILYDLEGKHNLDSIRVKISSFTEKKEYHFRFSGDIDTIITPGKGKRIYTVINRDSFPSDGESLRIQFTGWTKSLPVKINRKFHFPKIDLSKSLVNPRFTLDASTGLVLRSANYSEKSYTNNFVFNYNPTNEFKVGIGGGYFRFVDSVKTYSSYPLYINVAYKFLDPVYGFIKFGYCPKNFGPAISLGLGCEIVSYGPFGIELGAQYNIFRGSQSINAISLNAGLSFDFSSRKRFITDRVYRIKRNFLMYPEFGINYYNRPGPSISWDFAYRISPFYTQGIGISYEIINYHFDFPIELEYYSTYYHKNKTYIAGIQPVDIKINIVPIYVCGRLYFSISKFRNFIFWKYGYTVYSKLDKGSIKNGFVADVGFGFQFPVKKDIGLTLSFGAKYFNNEASYEGNANNIFGTFYLKTGIAF